MRIPQDPLALHQAAGTLGRSLAEGDISTHDARLACAALVDGHLGLSSYPNGETREYVEATHGLRARLCWTAMDEANAHAKAMWRAEDSLRDATRPLIRRRAPKAEVEEIAGGYAEILGWPRIYAILQDEVRRAKFMARWQ